MVLKRLKKFVEKILASKMSLLKATQQPCTYEEQIYSGLIMEHDVCFDVGANQGDVAVFMAKLAGKLGLVVAFEPVWEIYFQLCRHICIDRDIKAPIVTVPFGLADTNKDAIISVPNKNFGMGSMADSVAWSEVQLGAQLDTYRVKLLTLDSFFSETHLPLPTFIKIDVKGAELFVLYGAIEMFDKARHRPLMLIEIFAPWEKAFGYHPWKPLSWLKDRGYRFLFMCPNGLVDYTPSEERPFPPEYEMAYNVLAYCPLIHADRLQKVKWFRSEYNPKILTMPPPPFRNVFSKSLA
jgi:FkbM family methyltransferase